MEIPHTELAPETLQRLIESFVLREGTDYGHQDPQLENKVEQVKKQLDSGRAIIVYSMDDESISIIVKDN